MDGHHPELLEESIAFMYNILLGLAELHGVCSISSPLIHCDTVLLHLLLLLTGRGICITLHLMARILGYLQSELALSHLLPPAAVPPPSSLKIGS